MTVETEREGFEAWWGSFGSSGMALKNAFWEVWKARSVFATRTVPEGWKLVPVELTQEMFDAGMKHRAGHPCNVVDGYTAMLAAAPLPPASTYNVKQLEWFSYYSLEHGRLCYHAITEYGGKYTVINGEWWFSGERNDTCEDTDELAMEAAQADYDRRQRSKR